MMFYLMLGSWLHGMLSKYWILVCAVLFLVLAIQQPNVYRIIYMVLFLYFVISFQVWIFLLLCKVTRNVSPLLMYMHFCYILISFSYGKTGGYWFNKIQPDPNILYIFFCKNMYSSSKLNCIWLSAAEEAVVAAETVSGCPVDINSAVITVNNIHWFSFCRQALITNFSILVENIGQLSSVQREVGY